MIDDDMLGGDRLADPYPYFAQVLEHEPVRWNAKHRAWFIHKHADVLWALRNPAFSSDRVRPVEARLSAEQKEQRKPTYDVLRHWMVFLDPPEHTRLRKLVQPAFSPKAVAAMRGRVQQVVEETLHELGEKESFDFIQDFAYPVPAIIIAELIGVPASDRDRFKKWSDDILTLVFGAQGEENRRELAQQGLVELTDYLRDLIAEIRTRPDEDSVIASLLRAHDADPPLTDDEIISTCALLVFGGHETTTNLIANGTRQLLLHPDQWDLLKENPQLVTKAVEELLRFDGPSRLEARLLVEDVELRGQELKAGENVFLVQSAANRDPEVFVDPHRLDITRERNNHVGFGFGLHHCLGNFLARLEGEIAFSAVISALPDLELAGPETWHTTMMSRGMKTMPVRRTGRS